MEYKSLTKTELTVRAVLFLVLSLLLMGVDIYFAPFKTVRFYLDTLVSPFYSVSNSPKKINDYYYQLSLEKEQLIAQNKQLTEENLSIKSENQVLQSLEKENQTLRRLLNSSISTSHTKKIAQVVRVNTDPFAYQIVLDQGRAEGVFDKQPIADENGLLGQVFQLAQQTSRAILICDYHHAISVRNLRNDMAMVAQGNGCGNDLILDFIPTEADIEVGDELVSSGLDGVFPAGYPVATVSAVKMDPNRIVPTIYAKPKANVKQLRYVLLLGEQPLDLTETESINGNAIKNNTIREKTENKSTEFDVESGELNPQQKNEAEHVL